MTNLYFGEDVDDAIRKFQVEKNIKEKHKIYIKIIMPAFEKLINYHYYRLPVNKNPDIMHDCLVFLYEQIDKFNPERARGFPYFNVIVKNFFIQRLKFEKKQISVDQNLFSLNELSNVDEDPCFATMDDASEMFENKEYVEKFKEKLIEWSAKSTKNQEKVFLDALVSLFDNADNIDIYNKKAVFFYLREITGLNSKQVAVNVIKIRRKYSAFRKKYLNSKVQ